MSKLEIVEKSLILRINANLEIICQKSTNNAKVTYDLKSYSGHHYDITFDGKVLSIRDLEKEKVQNDITSKFRGSLTGKKNFWDVLFAGIKTVKDIAAEKNSYRKDSLTVFIPCLENFSVIGENCDLKMNSVNAKKIDLDVAALKLHEEKTVSKEMRVKSSSLKANVFFGKDNANIFIKANNGKVVVVKENKFDGAIRVTGNNVRTKGSVSGNNSVGLCKMSFNNGHVTVLQ